MILQIYCFNKKGQDMYGPGNMETQLVFKEALGKKHITESQLKTLKVMGYIWELTCI